jgi:hypothetical protein
MFDGYGNGGRGAGFWRGLVGNRGAKIVLGPLWLMRSLMRAGFVVVTGFRVPGGSAGLRLTRMIVLLTFARFVVVVAGSVVFGGGCVVGVIGFDRQAAA